MTNHSHASGFFMSKCQVTQQPDKTLKQLSFRIKTNNTDILFSVKMKKCLKTDCHSPHSMFGIKFDR